MILSVITLFNLEEAIALDKTGIVGAITAFHWMSVFNAIALDNTGMVEAIAALLIG